MKSEEVVSTDLQFICNALKDEFSLLSGKRLLITGGAGFLGYYLVQSVLFWNRNKDRAQRIHVTVWDNHSRGVPSWLSTLEGQHNLALAKYDVTKDLTEDVENFHYIIHAASIASPTYYRKHPIQTMDANVNGLRNLLEFARRTDGTQRRTLGFLFFSSSEIYGDPPPDIIPTPETYRGNVSCTGPRACYDEAKRFGETLCVNFSREYGMPVKIARPFNNYGPGLKITDGRVIPDFARSVVAGKDIVMFSDGSPSRTYCYVADAVIGYYKVLVKGRNGEAYNIGVEEPEISVADLAERIVALSRSMFDQNVKLSRQTSSDKDYLTDNPNRRCPSIRKAKTELGYNPAVSLDEGLQRSLAWYYHNREATEA